MMSKQDDHNQDGGQAFNPFQLFNGAFLPFAILSSDVLTPAEKLTWARLTAYAGQNGEAYPSLSTLAVEVGLAKSGLKKALNGLEQKGFLRRDRPGMNDQIRGKTTRYVFIWNSCLEKSLKKKPLVGGRPLCGLGVGHKVATNKNHIQKNHKTSAAANGQAGGDSQQDVDDVLDLTSDQKEFIRLAVDLKRKDGSLRNPTGFRLKLERMARDGSLDISDLDLLRAEIAPARMKPVATGQTEALPPDESARRARALLERLKAA